MIKFERIEIKNFGRFKEATFDFTEGSHLVLGKRLDSTDFESNGTGKSTLFTDAITWCIYDYSFKGKKVSYKGKGECYVKLYLSNNIGDKFQIERYNKHSQFRNDARLLVNDTDVLINKKKNLEDTIIDYGFPTFDLFVTTIIIAQGMPINFTTLTNTKRKELLEELFSFNIWNNLRKKTDKYYKQLKIDIKEILEVFNNKNLELTDIRARLDVMKTTKDKDTKDVVDKIRAAKLEIADKRLQLSELKYNKEIHVQTDKKRTAIDNTIVKLEGELQSNKNMLENPICDKCGNNLKKQDLAIIKNKIEDIENNINEYRIKLDKIDNMISRFISDSIKHDSLDKSISITETVMHELNARYVELLQEKNSKELEDTLLKLTDEMNIIVNEKSRIASELLNCEYIDSLLQPSSAFRTHLLEKYIIHLNSILSSIVPTMLGNITATLSIDNKGKGIDINITDEKEDGEYCSLSGGEKKRLDICIILALQLFLLKSSGISINLLVFDEIFDSLDAKGVENVLNTINQIYDSKTCIYIISHRENIKSFFTSIYTIKREDGVACIEV